MAGSLRGTGTIAPQLFFHSTATGSSDLKAKTIVVNFEKEDKDQLLKAFIAIYQLQFYDMEGDVYHNELKREKKILISNVNLLGWLHDYVRE